MEEADAYEGHQPNKGQGTGKRSKVKNIPDFPFHVFSNSELSHSILGE